MAQPHTGHNRISFCYAPEGKHGGYPKSDCRNDGNSRQTAHAHKQGDKGTGHYQFPFRTKNMGMAVQGLVNRERTTHITAPEKENTEFTILAAKAIKLMPKTTDKSSLNPPLISSLFKANFTV
jgi:hypothetical protein